MIRVQSTDTEDIFQLIPRGNLWDLPNSLVGGHFHWLNLSTSVIEIRPTENPWEQSPDNWTVHVQPGQSRVTKGGESLVDVHSPTWQAVSSCFRCLDDPKNLIITVSPIDTSPSPSLRLSIALPRYDLSFFVNRDGNLESCDFQDMVLDEGQCIGTLFGLVDQLVLRPKTQMKVDLIPKLVLIPYSSSLRQDGDNIHVDRPSSGPLQHYVYEVDSVLGCLKGVVGLESRLYLAHLHALTSSGCRPDPLSGRTGVEEAISLVWLAGTRQRTDHKLSSLPSPQICFAMGKIQDCTNPPPSCASGSKLPSEDALLQEAYLFPSEFSTTGKHSGQELDRLFHDRPTPHLHARNELIYHNAGYHDLPSPNIGPLRQLFASIQTNETGPAFQSQYISRLHGSAHHLQTTVPAGATRGNNNGKPSTDTLRRHFLQCRVNYTESRYGQECSRPDNRARTDLRSKRSMATRYAICSFPMSRFHFTNQAS